MTQPAVRVNDATDHGSDASPGKGSPNTTIADQNAWRAIVDIHACPSPPDPPHGDEVCLLGSFTVLINCKMACRVGDVLQGEGPPNAFAEGEPTVLIGDIAFGLADPATMAAYAEAMQDIINNWDTMTADERIQAMEDAVNAALPDSMPDVALSSANLAASTRGQFSFDTWTVDINQDILNQPMGADTAREMVGTLYHEARHAEQWWATASYLAAEGEDGSDIASALFIPQSVGEAAEANPASLCSALGAMGESTHASVYGDYGGYRNRVLGDIWGPGNYDRYRALPEEQDAWNIGDTARDTYNALPPPEPPPPDPSAGPAPTPTPTPTP